MFIELDELCSELSNCVDIKEKVIEIKELYQTIWYNIDIEELLLNTQEDNLIGRLDKECLLDFYKKKSDEKEILLSDAVIKYLK